MSAASTSRTSVQEPDFESLCPLVRQGRLVCGFCSSDQRFAIGFLQIPPRDGHPCRSASSSPCRACMGLQPTSQCALPGAQRKTQGRNVEDSVRAITAHRYPSPLTRTSVKAGLAIKYFVRGREIVKVSQAIGSAVRVRCNQARPESGRLAWSRENQAG